MTAHRERPSALRDGLSEERLRVWLSNTELRALKGNLERLIANKPHWRTTYGKAIDACEELLALRAENARIREEAHRRANEAQALVTEEGNRADEAEAGRDKMREALREFGQHAPECIAGQYRAGGPSPQGYRRLYGQPGNDRWYYDGEKPPCSCGLRAALGGQP